MNITAVEITRIRALLDAKLPEPSDHCDDECEHIECGYVVACEKYTAGKAQLTTVIGPLLDALEHSSKESERYKRERDYYQSHRDELALTAKKQAADEIAQLKIDLEQSRAQEQQTATVLDGFAGDLEKLKNVQIPLQLKCPQCDMIHVDQDEWATTRLHRKHLCHGCGHLWTPYLVTTIGVDVHAPCRTRRDELLEMVAKLSQSVPLESEVGEALNQRGVLLAEVGTLKSTIAEHEPQLQQALTDRQFLDDVLAGIGPFMPRTTKRTVSGIIGGVKTLYDAVKELQCRLHVACELATTHLPEDREVINEMHKFAHKDYLA